MLVELRASLAAEALAWDAPEANTTLVVKGTFELGSGVMLPATSRLPLSDDVASSLGHLHYASDRIPWKGSPEVLVVGHARASVARTSIRVSLRVGDALVKTCSARAGSPTRVVPLLESHLRRDAQSFEPVRLGPQLETPAAWLQRRLPPHFDFTAFNAAPPDQRLAALLPDASVTVEGVMPDGSPLRARLPKESPRVFLRASRSSDPVSLPVTCDTLWIDVDEHIACLVWRTVLPRPQASASFVVLWSAEEIDPRDMDAPPTTRRKPRKTAPTVDVNERLARQGAQLPFQPGSAGDASALERDKTAPMAPVPEVHGLPTHLAAALAQTDGEGSSTITLVEETIGLPVQGGDAAALPFAPGAQPTPADPPAGDTQPPPPPDSEDGEDDDTLTDSHQTLGVAFQAAGSLDESLPFKRDDGDMPAFLRSALEALGDNADAGGTLAFYGPSDEETPLPFVGEGDSAAVATPSPGAMPAPAPQAPPARPSQPEPFPLRGQPSPPNPIAPAAVDTPLREEAPAPPPAPVRRARVAMDQIAAVRVALHDGMSLTDALAEHDLDERDYRQSDRMLAIELAREDAEGIDTLASELERAIAAARAETQEATPPEEDCDLDVYVNIRAELEEADEAESVLGELGVTAERWARMRRSWTRRALAEPKIAKEIRDRLAAKRRDLRRLQA